MPESTAANERSAAETAAAPAADHPAKPDSPTEITSRSWAYVLRKTAREFSKDQCTDVAAALTYFSVLALFPGVIALISLVGLVGQGAQSVSTVTDILRRVAGASVADTLQPVLQQIASSGAVGVAFLVGLATALWSASGYVGAFGRALNRMYEVAEGRPFWKLRPAMVAVTAALVVLAALVLVGLVVSGPVAEAVGNSLGVGGTIVTVWSIVKWPVILAVVVLMVALLYWATPNLRQPRFRWLSVGAVVAILIWVVASVAFGFYVANFSSYNKTYGSLAGVVVFLLWLWLTNLALLFGAELDSELERGRQLQAGIAAEETVQLPARDTRGIEKAEKAHEKDVERGREIRLAHADDRPGDGSGDSARDDAG